MFAPSKATPDGKSPTANSLPTAEIPYQRSIAICSGFDPGPGGPAGPAGPGAPSNPGGPWIPCVPGSPLPPLSALAPLSPLSPFGAEERGGPWIPCAPGSPLSPLSPLSPFGPGGPVVTVGNNVTLRSLLPETIVTVRMSGFQPLSG